MPTNPPMRPPPAAPREPRPTTTRSESRQPTPISDLLPAATPKLGPPRLILNAVEGWGKTTAAALAPDPIILMARGETGYDTLYGAGLVPRVPRYEAPTWNDALGFLAELKRDHDDRQTVALDALGGFERLCHEHVCDRDFDGDWGEKGFAGYQRGYDVSVAEWLRILRALDDLRAAGMMVLILSHTSVRPFKNPVGPDFDRYVADVHHKTWGATHRWADAVLFGTFFSVVEEKKGSRAKGIGGDTRIIYTERRDTWDAKNRYGMASEIDVPNARSATWETIWNAITGGSDR